MFFSGSDSEDGEERSSSRLAWARLTDSERELTRLCGSVDQWEDGGFVRPEFSKEYVS